MTRLILEQYLVEARKPENMNIEGDYTYRDYIAAKIAYIPLDMAAILSEQLLVYEYMTTLNIAIYNTVPFDYQRLTQLYYLLVPNFSSIFLTVTDDLGYSSKGYNELSSTRSLRILSNTEIAKLNEIEGFRKMFNETKKLLYETCTELNSNEQLAQEIVTEHPISNEHKSLIMTYHRLYKFNNISLLEFLYRIEDENSKKYMGRMPSSSDLTNNFETDVIVDKDFFTGINTSEKRNNIETFYINSKTKDRIHSNIGMVRKALQYLYERGQHDAFLGKVKFTDPRARKEKGRK